MIGQFFKMSVLTAIFSLIFFNPVVADIPLPEHPRPDSWRKDWKNLNGSWEFQFDILDTGETDQWYDPGKPLSGKIMVPFSWGSPLSGVPDEGDIGWYCREIKVPESWKGKRIFLVVGACDWLTKGWLDGISIGENRGGYTPFEFELTRQVRYGQKQKLTLRVDDSEHSFKLEGKQGYGKARGIWQTVYLEARGSVFMDYVHITPDIDKNEIEIDGILSGPLPNKSKLRIIIKNETEKEELYEFSLKKKTSAFSYILSIPDPRLWTLDDPHLYNVQVVLEGEGEIMDILNTYFGMRKIGVGNIPGTDFPYVTLNNQPIYLQLTLDQAYHPEGYYTFPSDAFMRDEILRSKKIGLNGQRIHVKVGIPRKLYWADKLGLLIMADVPNSWGEPDSEMRAEAEKAMREMIKRDYNHPSIFSWILFNETWGLFTGQRNNRQYLPETQDWVSRMYQEAKALDLSRLVEDNSACNYDHVATDLNSWHSYLPGYAWKDFLNKAVNNTYEGSGWNFSEGYAQSRQPMINSECGNVWGYEGSTGDVDWSWDYHIMINEFRLHPKIAGWLYTEHHDVINEWNGYYKYDRTEKFTGLKSFDGMTLNDLHSLIQITPDISLMTHAHPGEEVEVPLWISVLTDKVPSDKGIVKYRSTWINSAGNTVLNHLAATPGGDHGPWIHQTVDIRPWQLEYIDPIRVKVPEEDGILILNLALETEAGGAIHKNFILFRIEMEGTDKTGTHYLNGKSYKLVHFRPDEFKASAWSGKQWVVLEGKKVNGTGYGYFEYELDIPEDIAGADIEEAIFKIELSSKELFGKDRTDQDQMEGDYMRGRGTLDRSRNPNAYPMTDTERFPSYARIRINGEVVKEVFLPDDPADHRGVLSWYSQPEDRKLREAGSYGYLINSVIPQELLKNLLSEKKCRIRIEVPDILPGGLAIYGKDFGRYPMDPTIVFELGD